MKLVFINRIHQCLEMLNQFSTIDGNVDVSILSILTYINYIISPLL
jgi:hypothetical protein